MKHNNKRKTHILKSALHTIFFLLITTVSINAQIIQWTHTYGGPGDDGSQSMFKLNVYDITGKAISTLVDENENTGTHQVKFLGDNLPSGIYVYTLVVNGDMIDSKKMMLIQ